MATKPSSSRSDCEEDCKEIHDAWGRLNQLGQVLAHRSRMELQQIRETYAAMYGEDLAHRLQKAHSANPKNEIFYLLALWVMKRHERDAVVARDAIELGDGKYKALIEIYAGRKSSQLLIAQQAYYARFKSHLDQDISTTDTPTPYQRILVALATSHKSHHADVSQHVAKCDAKRLFEAGEGRIGAIDESLVLEILSKRSIPQLKLTCSYYKHIYGHDYTKSLKKDTSKEFEDSLRTVVKCMYTPPKYYAKGRTTDKSALARVMVSRAEMDMDEIKEIFHRKYGMKLHDAICESIPKGEYRDFLLALATTRLCSVFYASVALGGQEFGVGKWCLKMQRETDLSETLVPSVSAVEAKVLLNSCIEMAMKLNKLSSMTPGVEPIWMLNHLSYQSQAIEVNVPKETQVSKETMSKETMGKAYEDFEPELVEAHKDGTDTILISLPGFRKEQIRVQLDGYGYLKISGEQQVSGNKWSRFRKEARVPERCDVNQIRATLDNGVLHITMPRLVTQASGGADQTKTGTETPKKAERPGKGKDDARPKTAAATPAAETQTKKATEPPPASDAPRKAVEKPTREEAEDAFPRADSTSAASARRAAADGKTKDVDGTPATASAGTVTADRKKMGAAAEGGDVKLPKEEAAKEKDGAKKEKEEDRGAVGKRKKPDVAAGDGSLEGGKRRAGEEKQCGIGGHFLGLDQRKQLVVNVMVASLVVVGLGLYITTKIRSHGNKE
ncbi:hypothetical protein ACLOJK_005701 [Asimina triloba]